MRNSTLFAVVCATDYVGGLVLLVMDKKEDQLQRCIRFQGFSIVERLIAYHRPFREQEQEQEQEQAQEQEQEHEQEHELEQRQEQEHEQE